MSPNFFLVGGGQAQIVLNDLQLCAASSRLQVSTVGILQAIVHRSVEGNVIEPIIWKNWVPWLVSCYELW